VYLLLSFTAIYLPRSPTWLNVDSQRQQRSSLDRPQHPFLAPLTANPALTVLWVCAGTFIINMWWAGWVRLWWAQEKNMKIDDSTKRVQAKIYAIRNAGMATVIGSIVFYVLLVSFGAPITSYYATTGSLSILLSILTVYTPIYTLPIPYFTLYGYPSTSDSSDSTASLIDKLTWTRLFSEYSTTTPVERALVYPVLGTLIGAWAGAFPLALDWDRPWQAWPLVPAYGAVFGHVLGSGYALLETSLGVLVAEGRRAKSE